MMNRDHMRAFLRRAAALVALVAVLWATSIWTEAPQLT